MSRYVRGLVLGMLFVLTAGSADAQVSLGQFVRAFSTWLSSAPESDSAANERLVRKIPELNAKLLRIAAAMDAHGRDLISLEGRRMQRGSSKAVEWRLKLQVDDLNRILRDVAQTIDEIQLPLTTANIKLADAVTIIVRERQSAIANAPGFFERENFRGVELHLNNEGHRQVRELHRVANLARTLVMDLDAFFKEENRKKLEEHPK